MNGLTVLSTRPLALRAATDVLTAQRLDLDFYLPERVEAEDQIAAGSFRSAKLNTLRLRERPITDGIRRHDKAEDGVHLIRTQNLAGPSVAFDGTAFISEQWHRTSLKSEVQAGDLLLAIRGYLGAAAIVRDGAPRSNINQHIARIGVDPSKCSVGYLWAFFCSRVGRTVLERYVTGTVQRGVTLPDLRALRVPVPDRRIQDYIGAKVELAERCRSRATRLIDEANSRFNALLATDRFRPTPALTNVVGMDHLVDRLSSEFYLPRYFDLDDHLRSVGLPVKAIDRVLRERIIRTTTPERTGDGAVPCILTSDIDPHEIRWRQPSLRVAPSVHTSHSGRLEPLDVVYTSVGPPVGEAAIVLKQFLPIAVGGDVSIIRHGEGLHPGFLSLFLNSIFGRMQNDRYSRGIRQRRVYPEDIGSFLIPLLSAKDQALIGDRVIQYEGLNERAVDLVNEAKADVEALIAGTLDTAAIIAGKLKPPRDEEALIA